MVYVQYKRTLTTFFDVLATVGGTFGSLKLVGVLFAKTFVGKLFRASLVRRLYNFTPRFESEVKKKKKQKGDKKGPKTFADEIERE